jgi:hypothetical protein
MRKLLYLTVLLIFMNSCSRYGTEATPAPGNEAVVYRDYVLQNADTLHCTGDCEQIRLQTGLIRLFPESGTCLKKFNGMSSPTGIPGEEKWASEENGKYRFAPDSTYLLLSFDTDTVRYFPGHWSAGRYIKARMEQHDSVFYSNSLYSAGFAGWFVYGVNP